MKARIINITNSEFSSKVATQFNYLREVKNGLLKQYENARSHNQKKEISKSVIELDKVIESVKRLQVAYDNYRDAINFSE